MSPDYVRSLLSYNPGTGEFTWLVKRGLARPGMVAGTPVGGRTVIRIDRRNYLAHRLAWLVAHGRWPDDQLDHINGDPLDNRLANLRACTHAENHQNERTRRDNRLGLTGVSVHRHSGLYSAEIKVAGKRHLLGYHRTPDAAHAAYLEAKARLHAFQPVPRPAPSPSPVSSEGERP